MLMISDSKLCKISQAIVYLYICFVTFIRTELTTATTTTGYLQKPPVCNSEIYCYGNLLHTIQLKGIYSDSKKFVDKKMKFESSRILNDFQALLNRTNNDPNITILNEFIDRNFESGSEFEAWVPEDLNLKNLPKFIETIGDKRLRDWAVYLIEFWKSLGRKFKDDVRVNSHLYSAIYVPNPVIVPGGRFLEFYYWDSYWIIKGLLLSNMFNTSKGMIENFLYIVNKYKFIPNGGRIYYLNRSQPPLLIPMFKAYFDATQDIEFLSDSLSTLEKEYDYWITKHMIIVEKNNRNYSMAIYRDFSRGPRPESYKEDYHSAKIFQTDEEKENFYSNIKAAAESGWDFSTRWFILGPEKSYEKGNLTDTQTQSIVPVDLNAILYRNSKILAHFNRITNNIAKSDYYEQKATEFLEAVTNVLWHPEIGAWLDFDIVHKERRNNFYPSNIFPLWTNCYDVEQKTDIVTKVLDYLARNKVKIFLGGVPTSFFYSGEQWDYPLAWPPLQYIMIMGLDNTGIEQAKILAYEISKKWINSTFEAFKQKNLMFEKYDASVFGSSGDGGEYHVQDGFGWTNGIIIELLSKYGSTFYDESIEEGELSQYSAAINHNNSKGFAKNTIFFYMILMPTLSMLMLSFR